MIDSICLAWRYVVFNRARTAILVACLTVVTTLPMAVQLLMTQAERQLTARAENTPLIGGAKGSPLDLAINTLYFKGSLPSLTTMAEVERINQTDLAYAIPIYNRFRASNHPIVGTTLDYFSFRSLEIAHGSFFAQLGEVVIGSNIAKALEIGVHDHLVSAPENMFDLAGIYPLKMRVSGVLAPSFSPDDDAVFVDVKTAWVIEGLGHGHEDLAKTQDRSIILSEGDNSITANARLFEYQEITPDNIHSFHFHGDLNSYPLSAAIVIPHDHKGESILRGRYQNAADTAQLLRPVTVIDELIKTIAGVKSVFDLVFVLVASTMLLALILIMVLSLRMRQKEVETITKLGCKRTKIAEMMAAEVLLIVAASFSISCLLVWIVGTQAKPLIEWLVL